MEKGVKNSRSRSLTLTVKVKRGMLRLSIPKKEASNANIFRKANEDQKLKELEENVTRTRRP